MGRGRGRIDRSVEHRHASLARLPVIRRSVERDGALCFMQVTPMTALKFAELAAKAGFPKGVINILPGSGKTEKV